MPGWDSCNDMSKTGERKRAGGAVRNCGVQDGHEQAQCSGLNGDLQSLRPSRHLERDCIWKEHLRRCSWLR